MRVTMDRERIERWSRWVGDAKTLLELVDAAQSRYNGWLSNRRYTVTVSADNVIYPEVLKKILVLLPADRHRSLASAARNTDTSHDLVLMYNGLKSQKIAIAGHTVSVFIDRDQGGAGGPGAVHENMTLRALRSTSARSSSLTP